MAADLRTHIKESIKGQLQLLQLAAVAAGVIASFGWDKLDGQSDALVLLGLLFLGFTVAILRLDQEIAIAASHLLDRSSLGEHAPAQADWERHKLRSMQQSGVLALIASSTQTAAVYSIPLLAAVAATAAALKNEPTELTPWLMGVEGLMVILFVVGSIDVVRRYQRLGDGPAT
jgi:hypothetical protein